MDNSESQLKTFGYLKRGMKTVRFRATEFIDTLRIQHIKELPLAEAQEQFSLILDIWDRTTIKAYFGLLPNKSKRKIDRWAQYQNGTKSLKTIELSQDIPYQKGYLEKLRLVYYEQRGKNWFMVLENPILVPELMKLDRLSISNFSLSPNTTFINSNGEGLGRETSLQARTQEPAVGCPLDIDREKREREIIG